MRILGIDPGTVTLGYGVIEDRGDEPALVIYGTLDCSERSPIGERLFFLYTELDKLIIRYEPGVVAVEQPFVAKNVKSALAIGKAQAVALLAAASHGLAAYEYSPEQVKQRVANYGTSSKEQVQEMVRLQLGLGEAPQPLDAADALAVALCHSHEMRLANLLNSR
jgi:crossover junction endodeoxyribonuclease RuvC